MLTERQRRMTKDAMNAAETRAKELCSYLGYNPDDVYLQENLDRVDRELTRRQKARAITMSRRSARVAKGQARFVEGDGKADLDNEKALFGAPFFVVNFGHCQSPWDIGMWIGGTYRWDIGMWIGDGRADLPDFRSRSRPEAFIDKSFTTSA
jgi:hypothetical protein